MMRYNKHMLQNLLEVRIFRTHKKRTLCFMGAYFFCNIAFDLGMFQIFLFIFIGRNVVEALLG